MIKNFRHKGLQLFFETGKKLGINSEHMKKLRLLLANLNAGSDLREMNLPGYRFHKMKGKEKEYYSLTISGNRRIVFKFDGENVRDVDYLDYH
jgi:proteic killer suppression protein